MGPWSPGSRRLGCTCSVTKCVAYTQSQEGAGLGGRRGPPGVDKIGRRSRDAPSSRLRLTDDHHRIILLWPRGCHGDGGASSIPALIGGDSGGRTDVLGGDGVDAQLAVIYLSSLWLVRGRHLQSPLQKCWLGQTRQHAPRASRPWWRRRSHRSHTGVTREPSPFARASGHLG